MRSFGVFMEHLHGLSTLPFDTANYGTYSGTKQGFISIAINGTRNLTIIGKLCGNRCGIGGGVPSGTYSGFRRVRMGTPQLTRRGPSAVDA